MKIAKAFYVIYLGKVLQFAREDEHIGSRSIHLEQRVMRDVEIDFARMWLGRWEDRVKATLTENMTDKACHGILDLSTF